MGELKCSSELPKFTQLFKNRSYYKITHTYKHTHVISALPCFVNLELQAQKK